MGLAALVFGAALAYLASRLRPEWMGVFFVGVLLSTAVSVVLQNRDLRVDLPPDIGESAADRAGQIITLVCLTVALERAVRFVLRREYTQARGGWLLTTLLLFIVAVNLLGSSLGTHSGFSVHLLYAPLFAVAVFAYAQENVERCVIVTRDSLLVFLLASLAVLPIRREMVAEPNYAFSFVPGVTDRFYGFASHANTLAPLCFVLMSCLLLQPFRRRWLTMLAWIVASICVVLTQSKTSIALAILLVAVILIRAKLRVARERDGTTMGIRTLRLLTGLSLAATVVLTLSLLGMVAIPKFTEMLPPIVDIQQMSSLTGRTTIWSETLKVVRANPLFGYGPTLWDLDFQRKTGMGFSHAHSQYVQTLGAAGIVGLVALICYLLVLLRTSWRARVGSRGVSFALALFVIIRGITEVPLSVSTAMQGEFLIQMFLLALCVGYLPATQRRSSIGIRQRSWESRP